MDGYIRDFCSAFKAILSVLRTPNTCQCPFLGRDEVKMGYLYCQYLPSCSLQFSVAFTFVESLVIPVPYRQTWSEHKVFFARLLVEPGLPLETSQLQYLHHHCPKLDVWVFKSGSWCDELDGISTATPRSLSNCFVLLFQFSDIAGNAYPDVYEEFLHKLNFINVDIGFFVSSSCLLAPNFFGRLLFSTIMPLVVLVVLRGCYAVAKRRNANSWDALRVVKNKHLSAALFVVFLVYSSVAFTVFQTFVCDTLDNGISYLRADYSLTCSGAVYTSFKLYAISMVCVYPVGIPLFVAWWLSKHQKDLRRPDRETRVHLEPFSDVWAAYKPSRFFFEVVEFSRRLTLTGIAVFVLPGSTAQIAIVLLLAVVFLFISESLSPFKEKIDMGLYRWGNGIVLGSMYVALLVKVDVSKEDTGTLSAFAAVLIAANVFMVIAVVVQTALMLKEWFETRKPM